MNNKGETTNKSVDQMAIFGLDLGVSIDKRVLRVGVLFFLELAVLFVTGYFLLVPRMLEINKLRNNLELQDAQLESMTVKLETLEVFETEAARYDVVLRGALPITKDVGLTLGSLRQLARETQIEIVSYSVDPVVVDESGTTPTRVVDGQTAGAKAGNFRMDLAISGQSGQVQNFLELINTSLPLKVVEDMEIIRGDVQTVGGVLEMRVVIKSFYLPFTQKANPEVPLKVLSEEERLFLDQMTTFRTLSGVDEGTIPLGNQNLFGL